MDKGRKVRWLVLLAPAALVLWSGCASICGVAEKAPPPPPKPQAKVEKSAPVPVSEKPEAPPALPTSYTVEKCDDLWSIAAKPQIYGAPWLWPLIWDANRKLIKDPNKIKEGMVLAISRDASEAVKADARKRAAKFPKYRPPAGAKRYCPPK